RTNAGYHLTRSKTVADYAHQNRTHFGEIRRASCEPTQTGIGVCDDGSEGLIDFVGDRRRHRSHRRLAAYLRQLVARRPQLLFSVLEVGDIASYGVYEACIDHGRPGQPAVRAISVPKAVFEQQRFSAAEEPGHFQMSSLRVVRVTQPIGGLAEQI